VHADQSCAANKGFAELTICRYVVRGRHPFYAVQEAGAMRSSVSIRLRTSLSLLDRK
jgi:hypothetical protein